MKKIIPILLIALLSGCEKDLEVYNGESGIYFDTRANSKYGISNDTITVAWGKIDSDIKEHQLSLRVCLFGDVASHDRNFSVNIYTDYPDTLKAQAGIDFVQFPTEYTIPAFKNEAFIDIQLLRTETLLEHPVMFKVELKETPELMFSYSRFLQVDSVTTRAIDIQRVIRMTEDFQTPRWWGVSRIGERVFGTWSVKKSILICDVMGISRTDWVESDLAGNPFTEGYLRFVGKYMHRWLQENPTEEDDGTLMVMGSDSRG